MTYRGKVKNGVVLLEGDAALADGTMVRVEPVDDRPLMELVRLTEHDHYLYGTPKRGQ